MMSERIHRTLNKGVSKTRGPGLSFFKRMLFYPNPNPGYCILRFKRMFSLLLAPLRDENKLKDGKVQ